MRKIFITCLAVFVLCSRAYTAQIPQGQDIGSRVRGYENEKIREEMTRELAAPRQNVPSLAAEPIENLPGGVAAVYVAKIVIQSEPGVNISENDKTLAELMSDYKNKMLSVEDMKALANAITGKIAVEGIKAYVPRQSFDKGVMYINVVSAKKPLASE